MVVGRDRHLPSKLKGRFFPFFAYVVFFISNLFLGDNCEGVGVGNGAGYAVEDDIRLVGVSAFLKGIILEGWW